jgi:hypothetical protein
MNNSLESEEVYEGIEKYQTLNFIAKTPWLSSICHKSGQLSSIKYHGTGRGVCALITQHNLKKGSNK